MLSKQALYHEPLQEPFSVLGIFEMGLTNYLPGLASNCDPPNLCFLSSLNYSGKPLVPGFFWFLKVEV
jgi:hypothetical protein